MQDVAKCMLDCDRLDCGYKNSSSEVEMNFKYYCIDKSRYFMKFESGQSFRDTIAEEVEKIGN